MVSTTLNYKKKHTFVFRTNIFVFSTEFPNSRVFLVFLCFPDLYDNRQKTEKVIIHSCDNNSILDNLSTHKVVLRAKSIFSFSAKTISFGFWAIFWVVWKNNFEICVRSRGIEFYLKNKFRIGVFTKKPNQQLEYSKYSFVAVLCTQNSKTDLFLNFWKLRLGLCTTLFSVYFLCSLQWANPSPSRMISCVRWTCIKTNHDLPRVNMQVYSANQLFLAV